jgi:hypothetical protein
MSLRTARLRHRSRGRGVGTGGTGGSTELVPSFRADLNSSLNPRNAWGSNVATFTRATDGTYTDYSGQIKTATSNQARFQGGRVVENLIVASEDMTNAAYAVNASAVVDSATQVTYDGTSDGDVRQTITITDDGSGAGGRTFVFSAYISSSTSFSASDVLIRVGGNATGGGEVEIGALLTTTPQRFAVTVSTDAAGTTLIPLVRCQIAATLTTTKWMLEEKTGALK